MKNKLLILVTLTAAFEANAHCPALFKKEAACFMLEANKIYIYDQKVPHSGPYKDLKETLTVTDEQGSKLVTERISRGLINIQSPKTHSSVFLHLKNEKILLKAEK